MKTIQTTKRLYSIAASPPLKSSVRATPTSPRPRRASLSLASAVGSPSPSSSASSSTNVVGTPGSRSLYTSTSGSLHYFDSAGHPPPPPPPTSRPSNPHVVSTSRLLVGESQTQSSQGNASGSDPSANTAQSPHFPNANQISQQSSHSQSHHGQTSGGQQAEGGSQPIVGSSSLMLTFNSPTPPPGSSPPDRNVLLGGPRSSHAIDQAWRSRESAVGTADKQAEDKNITGSSSCSQKIYQFDVGAYGIPKRGREKRRPCGCPVCAEESEIFAMDSLDDAVQVGEDAYFVRENALGVADGVGGWSSRNSGRNASTTLHSCSTCAATSPSTSSRHVPGYRYTHRPHASQPSPSALFARRLMHFCAWEVDMARSATSEIASIRAEKGFQIAPIARKPSLKHGSVSPRASTRPRAVTREYGNARPFLWPWEADYGAVSGAEVSAVADEGGPQVNATLDTCKDTTASVSQQTSEVEENDPLKGTIDPVNILERAYAQTVDAHRVRRRIRVVKRRKSAGRWWPYGLGLGSITPTQSYKSLVETLSSTELENMEDCELEWQESWEPLVAGSSTALLAVLTGNRLRVAHLGDCVGWLVRAGEIVWRSEEMWWGFNFPVQLGPSSPTRPADARRYELSVQADDILILASDGMSDNCWEEDVLDEVRRAVEVHLSHAKDSETQANSDASVLGRRTLAGMLSEALCSRARQVSMQAKGVRRIDEQDSLALKENKQGEDAEELPFARRAREEGRSFRGGKCDDISVLVAIISPVEPAPAPSSPVMGVEDSISDPVLLSATA